MGGSRTSPVTWLIMENFLLVPYNVVAAVAENSTVVAVFTVTVGCTVVAVDTCEHPE